MKVSERFAAAIQEYEYEAGEVVRIHAGKKEGTFVVEYSDGEEYLVAVQKIDS